MVKDMQDVLMQSDGNSEDRPSHGGALAAVVEGDEDDDADGGQAEVNKKGWMKGQSIALSGFLGHHMRPSGSINHPPRVMLQDALNGRFLLDGVPVAVKVRVTVRCRSPSH